MSAGQWKRETTYLPPRLRERFAKAVAIDGLEVSEVIRNLVVRYCDEKLGVAGTPARGAAHAPAGR